MKNNNKYVASLKVKKDILRHLDHCNEAQTSEEICSATGIEYFPAILALEELIDGRIIIARVSSDNRRYYKSTEVSR